MAPFWFPWPCPGSGGSGLCLNHGNQNGAILHQPVYGKAGKRSNGHKQHKPKVWWRYIDNIFTIWEHGQESLKLFLQQSNLFHTTIKFMAEMSMEPITFLDTTVILENDILHTDLYSKPTDTHQYLSPNSCHPKHCTTSIPYSQGLRLWRICLRREDFMKRLNRLRDYLLACGYDTNSVDYQIQRAALMPCPQTIQPFPWRQQPHRVPLVTTYHHGLTSLTTIVNKHLPILHASKS